MFRRFGLCVGALALLSVLSVGCGGKPVVGVLLPSTGEAGTYGESIESGVRLAISDARDREELPVGFEVVWVDTQSDPERAVSELRRLVDERSVKMIIGGATSSEARALVQVLDDLGVVCLSPTASVPGISKQSKLFFRLFPSDELEGHTAARFMFDRLGQTRTVVYSGADDYATGIEPEFTQQFADTLGGEIISRIDLKDSNWRATSDDVLPGSGVGAVYIIGYAPQILEVVTHLRENGYGGKIVTTSAFFSDRVLAEAGPLAEGILFPLPPFDRTSDKEPVLSFVNRYMDSLGKAPDVFAAHGYDAMWLTIQVMTIADPPETNGIRKAFHFGMNELMGVTGPILFDDYGDVKHYPKMFIVKDTQVVSYQRYIKVERERILREVQDLLVTGGN
ncbi:MAG: branched-chain amino acid ABC transporter substrate-binding protein [Thermoanaerobaculales bacterium]|jgi:branched-chain amino acid transport system substrate-binding protein|nr:branched-chain amino acid ABC transporter substrate-binding protein [Thermoanaerobaculales bacterium]